MCALGITLLVLITVICFSAATIPDYIHVCNSKDPEVSRCIANSINRLKPKLRTGIPELEVPPMEPLILDTIKLRQEVQSNVADLKVKGSSNFKIIELKANIPRNRFSFKLLIPKLEFMGRYELDMKVFFVNIRGNGPIYGNFSNYFVEGLMKGEKIVRNGEEYLKFEKMKLRVRLGDVFLRLENLFNGDKVLGDVANSLINENSDIFINEIRPTLENALAEKFTDIANKITLKFTYKELFL